LFLAKDSEGVVARISCNKSKNELAAFVPNLVVVTRTQDAVERFQLSPGHEALPCFVLPLPLAQIDEVQSPMVESTPFS
jgi:hypothetical protein